jgi:hypothetical protein
MVETNIRILQSGMALSVPVRRARVTSTHTDPDLLEKVCSQLRRRHQLAAIPMPDEQASILVAGRRPIPAVRLEEETRAISIEDAGELPPLTLEKESDRALLPSLIERVILASITREGLRWVIAGAPRVWYQARPFKVIDGIAGYRRIAISALLIENVGIGVAADLQTSFLTERDLDWYFDDGLLANEGSRRRALFYRLAEREQGQGTLLYTRGSTRSTCYFVEALPRLTCGHTSPVQVAGESYSSVFDYYSKRFPELHISPTDRAITVSFKIGSGSQVVAAKLLKLRVFNDALPERLQECIAISPAERRQATLQFWNEFRQNPLAPIDAEFEGALWTPAPTHVWHIRPPTLHFGKQTTLRPPNGTSSYREYWTERTKTLESAGCFQCPPMFPRVIYSVSPNTVDEMAVRALVNDVRARLKKWTGKEIGSVPLTYDRIQHGITSVNDLTQEGILLFVMNDEPSAYFDISLHLGHRRPQHMAAATLLNHFDKLKNGAWDRRAQKITARRGRMLWDSFVSLVAINLLQLYDGVPWTTEAGPFEATVVIDVGHDRRHFGLSVLLIRENGASPEFCIQTEISPKADVKHESINAVVLRDEILKIVRRVWQKSRTALNSMLFVRDGRICGDEATALAEVRNQLISESILASNARVEAVDFAKDMSARVRMWDVCGPERVENVIEGTAIEISDNMVVVANTGRATLHNGTAEPVAMVARTATRSLRDAAEMSFYASQLNWTQPRVAARLMLPLSRTDEELVARAQHEARHTR